MSSRGRRRRRNYRYYAVSGGVVVFFAVVLLSFLLAQHATTTNSSTTTSKPVIMYVNQGNGVVNESNFSQMLSFAASRGFNTVFFQVYRQGTLLFNASELEYFVENAHAANLRIFFALYFTGPSQLIPQSIYSLGEDGVSLDMSTLDPATQTQLFSSLYSGYHSGLTAITTTNVNITLRPNWLVLETYGVQNQVYIRHGIIASVAVFATSSKSDYEQQLQYALNNSDGVMVFDYAGLMKAGY
jgi:hypothetical protein